MPKLKKFDVRPKLARRGRRLPFGKTVSTLFLLTFLWRLISLTSISEDSELLFGRTNLNNIFTPIHSGDVSPIVFVCCEQLFGEEGNKGQLSRSLPKYYSQIELTVDVRYMNAPCFHARELKAGNPKDRGENWPLHKSFPAERLAIFRQRIAEVHQQGGVVLSEGNCKIPSAELANVWLESMMDETTGRNATVHQYIFDKFLLQDKKELRRILVKHGYEPYVPKHYSYHNNNNATTNELELEFPLVLKREKSEGGVGVYIVDSFKAMEGRMAEDNRFETMGMRHKKSRHRTLGSGWVLEEFLPGATQELIVYIRPRGTSDGRAYFWCGSHSNQRWHDDGNFVKGYEDLRGTVTTPKNCNNELLELMSTVMKNEGIYGTGCINYKYGRDGKPKIHDWNLRTCATMATWNKGAVFLAILKQIPRRPGSKQFALFLDK